MKVNVKVQFTDEEIELLRKAASLLYDLENNDNSNSILFESIFGNRHIVSSFEDLGDYIQDLSMHFND